MVRMPKKAHCQKSLYRERPSECLPGDEQRFSGSLVAFISVTSFPWNCLVEPADHGGGEVESFYPSTDGLGLDHYKGWVLKTTSHLTGERLAFHHPELSG